MKQTDYAGIDYGLGKSNINSETGIRFGVIGQNALNPEITSCIWDNGRNLSFENYQDEAKQKLRSALEDYLSDYKWSDEKQSRLDEATERAFEAVSDDLSDAYQGEGDTMLYTEDGYKIQTTETELIILCSPYYTFAQYCSPCFPGAGNLETHCPDGPKTYCLGPDWFDDDKAPYPVYDVATGEQVGGGQ